MTTSDIIIFAFGIFATLMLLGGLLYTVREFREISNHPERFKPKIGLWATGEKPSEAESVNKG